jgi:hypothetical protein
MNSFGWYFLGIILLLDGIWTSFGGETPFKGKGWLHPSFEYSVLTIAIGCTILISTKLYFRHNKLKKIEYSKCPRCKTAYDYQKLDKGLCPKCHIPTIDMDEYFKQFPDELKDKKESKGA